MGFSMNNFYDVIVIGGGPAGGAGAGAGENGDAGHGQGFLSGEIKAQLAALFPKFQNPVIVEAELDESPLSGELAGFVGELDGLTDKLICREGAGGAGRQGRAFPVPAPLPERRQRREHPVSRCPRRP